MNLEVQKYYTDNKTRIAFINEEIKRLGKENTKGRKLRDIYEKEMKAKVGEICHYSNYEIRLNDFHSLCLEIINKYLEGYPESSYYEWKSYIEEDNNIKNITDVQTPFDIEVIFKRFKDFYGEVVYSKTGYQGCLMYAKEWNRLCKEGDEIISRVESDRARLSESVIDYSSEIASLNKEKEMLIKINKRIEKDYKNDIIILK